MMPDLGKYAVEVLSAYAASLAVFLSLPLTTDVDNEAAKVVTG